MLVDGIWTGQDRPRTGSGGEFVRPVSPFRDVIGAPDGRFPAEAGRYHLFVNAGCPWAYRTILYRSLKQLSHLIGISFTEPAAGEEGWHFTAAPEPLPQARHLHQVYSAADPQFTGRCTVPVLWDLHERTIVNNESADIIRMFDSAFDALEGVNPVRFYPDSLAGQIDTLNERIYADVNNGVYRCGFARSQAAYDEAFDRLFATLDELDQRLAGQRYLCGDLITEADWRLFATLVRFDAAYHGQFRCNRNLLSAYAHLWPYTRDLYQQSGVAETVDLNAIKGIYYGGRPPGILPRGPALDFLAPHGREVLSGSPS
jgi:putative glutathione S-transferase